MKIERFEDIEAWKEARILIKEIYRIFFAIKDYGFKAQIQSSSVSIMSNIAEGFDRGTNKEFIHFLIISRGSVSEVRSLLYTSLDIGYLDENNFKDLGNRCQKISNLLNGFIRYLKGTERKN
jgi:four helix bundle protein